MLASIGYTRRIQLNPTPQKSNTAKENHIQNTSIFFSDYKIEETKNPEFQHAKFLDIPQEIFNKIGDFLDCEDILKCMLPLSKKVFQIVFSENFKLRIPTSRTFLEIEYNPVMEIGYEEFLSNKILELQEILGNHRCPLPTWTRLHYMNTAVHNVPTAFTQNLGNKVHIDDFLAVMSPFILATLTSILIYDVTLRIPLTQILLEQILVKTHMLEVSIALLVVTFIYFEFKNPKILPTAEQRSVIAHRAMLTNLEKHLSELIQLYENIRNERI